jgi:hypothetical protein
MRKITKLLVDKVNELRKGGKTYRQIAKECGICKTTVGEILQQVYDHIEDVIDVDREATRMAKRDELAYLKRQYQEAIHRVVELKEELATYVDFASSLKLVKPMGIEIIEDAHAKHATPVLVCSDWHVDEVITSESIGGVNEYNLDIARARITRLANYSVKLVSMLKKESEIDTLLVAALGDFMSSWIHDELIETNSMTPPETLVELLNMWIGVLDTILDSGVVKRVHFVGCVGNHSRITKKPQFKNRAKKSYEWVLYKLLMQHYATKGETRITFQHPQGYFNWATLYGYKLRFHHGDNVQYHGGVGGVHIPLRKAIAQWDKVQRADLDVLGHWHTEEWSKSYVINGSVIGYSAFAEKLKADYNKAGQVLFLMHPKYGKTAQFPIILQD